MLSLRAFVIFYIYCSFFSLIHSAEQLGKELSSVITSFHFFYPIQVSHTLKSLADAKGPDADDLSALGTSVEDFAVQLLEPLKSDDLKRAIFEGKDFDRVSDKAVKYRQKKVSLARE